MNTIIDHAAQLFDVPAGKIVGRGRTHQVAIARNAVVYAARRVTHMSYEEIAMRLRRHYSTIMYLEKSAERLATEDYDYALRLAALL